DRLRRGLLRRRLHGVPCAPGPVSLHHESVNGWSTDQTAGRCKQLARQWCAWLKRQVPDWNIRPENIPVKIDADGLGSGVVDQAGEYNFIAVHGSGTACRSDDYPKVRSELWFNTAELARAGKVSFARLPAAVRQTLRQQALAVTWEVDGPGP